MISLIIVSHSQLLAEGVVELASQMTHGKVLIRAAAGIDDPANPIGTDATKIMLAVEEAGAEDDILVLVDMGSALLSTDMALELIDPELAERVHVCPAPIVEGGVAAAVAAAAGLPIEAVIEEAKGALAAKYEQLGETDSSANQQQSANQLSSEDALCSEWQVENPHGIHARPASTLVTTLAPFKCNMVLAKSDKQANAKSINAIALLGIRKGDQIRLIAQGEDAKAAISAFEQLAHNHFGESLQEAESALPETTTETEAEPEAGKLSGIPASAGIAVAPACLYHAEMAQPGDRKAEDAGAEWDRFVDAAAKAQRELQQLHAQTLRSGSEQEAEIFTAHQQILNDPDLQQQIRDQLAEQNIEHAWFRVIEETAEAWGNAEDSYLRARKNDILDIGQRMMRLLQGKEQPSLNLTGPAIVIAHDLTPSDTLRLDPDLVKGLCLEIGGATSHSAILARSLGIPAVVGCTGLLSRCEQDGLLILDGQAGTVNLQPSPAEITEANLQLAIIERQRQQALIAAQQPAQTSDGKAISVVANVATLQDARRAAEQGAEGVGLLRSEFLFMDRDQPPTEEEQRQFYSQVCEHFPEGQVVVRTLDIGGDKPLPWLQQSNEENPFLGSRGLRLCLKNPDVFITQLRALLRVRANHPNLAIMLPMVSVTEELIEAKALLQQAHQQLLDEGIASEIPATGIMIEVPSAVVCADALAQHADFFSIGSNDLTQYVMAADRGNEAVSYISSAEQPAVFRMIEQTAKAAHAQNINVSVCGEMASDARLTATLIGLGVEKLSMSSPAVATVKTAVRQTDSLAAQQQSLQLLQSATLAEVRAQLD